MYSAMKYLIVLVVVVFDVVVGCGCVGFFVCFISAAVVIKAGEFRNISI